MRCVRCGCNSKYPQRKRYGGACPGCSQTFAFEPREGAPLTDQAFQSAIDRVSSGGTVRFTKSNLHHAVASRIKSRAVSGWWALVATGLVLAVAGGTAGSGATAVFGIITAVAGIILAAAPRRPPSLGLAKQQFDRLYSRWTLTHGVPAKLIRAPAPALPPAPKLAEELESYSFDRAVICDQPETVDVLLGNDFHFENNCAVLTADGYPPHAFPVVRKMLRQNPRLEVFVLHDATVEGCKLAHRLKADPDWFGGTGVRVFDVALRPAQAQKQPRLVWSQPARRVEPHPALSEPERKWLETHWMAIAAFTPEQIIKRLFHAINGMPEQADTTGGDGGVIYWTSDAHASDGGGDSFG